MSKRKLLINEVFEKAKRDSERTSKSSLALYLKVNLEPFKLFLDEKTFSRYYDAFVLGKTKEMAPDQNTLDKLSEYLNYKDFADFSRTFIKKDDEANKTTVKISIDKDVETVTEKLSNIIINITNEQYFKMPEFIKKNGLGIMEAILLISFVTGGVLFSRDKSPENFADTKHNTENVDGHTNFTDLSIPDNPSTDKEESGLQTQKTQIIRVLGTADNSNLEVAQCMYWNGNEYIAEFCNSTKNGLIALDLKILENLKKITSPDTITEKSLGKVWYSKLNNNVEFFTYDGKNPENGKELKILTKYMMEKHIK